MARTVLPAVRRHGGRQAGSIRRCPWRVRAAALACAALAVALPACSSSPTETAAQAGDTAAARPSGEVAVFAATSLTSAFNMIASEFEKADPGVHVIFNYNGSSTLATQLTGGAPADVFASASPTNMTTVTDKDLTSGTPKTFARNEGEIMVEAGNPKHITSVADLAKPGVKVVLCAEQVPCGAVAETIFKNAGVTVSPVSRETNVGGVITKVSLGEADAGIVYVTDVKANGAKTTGVPIPADQNAITSYPIAELKDAPNAKAAAAFINFVLGPDGQHVLASYGFLPAG
jgi:molybdate transport system substrate-binding protein